MANQVTLDRAFAACAHPIRRGIVERLAEREALAVAGEGSGDAARGGSVGLTVAEATRDFAVSRPAISRHLRVLEEAGAIVRVIDGRTHRLRLAEQPFEDASDWIGQLRAMWERKFDVVEQFIAEGRSQGRPESRGGGAA
jgi:DNA-binding transcriptional ArsR family regulator